MADLFGEDIDEAVEPEPLPVLMKIEETINVKEAMHRSGRSDRTIREWCRRFGIGSHSGPGSPMDISAPALEMVRAGDFRALDDLRLGLRNSPRVRRYFDFLGLPI